ncbi:MAG TPA: carboxypeptidase regulatory-like domain-containing protein [Candidatus Rifleibacterium sp.]|nr:carboxypeptidase regulatory-like domain-containing protein [Candidatus Rifleibacterium sp.]
MSLRKPRNLVLLAVFHLLMLAAFLPGCKEGTKTSPVSAILTADPTGQGTLISNAEDAIHTISGVVSSQTTSNNISGIEVGLYLNKQLVAKTLSTSDGQFYFAKVPPGLYELTFGSSKAIADFASSTYILRVLEDGSTQPTAPAVKLAPTNQERLKVQAKIQGEVVVNGAGTKLANINVDLVDGSNFVVTSSLTDSVGHFVFESIGTGTYTIKAGKASAYNEEPQQVTVREDGVVSPLYSVLSMTLTPTQSKYNIVGTLISQFNSEKLANATASLYLNGALQESTRTTSDGQFYFAQYSANLYEIRFSLISYKDNSIFLRILEDGKMSPENPIIKLEPVNPQDIKIEAKIEGEIVVFQAGTKLANINVELFDELNNSISTALTNNQGYFSFDKLVIGTYRIKAGKASIYDIDDKTSVTIRNDGVVSPRYAVIALKPSPVETTYQIQGTVISQSTSEKLANVVVTLFDKDKNYVDETRTTSDGLFYFSKRSTGLYEIACKPLNDAYYPATLTLWLLDGGVMSPANPIAKLESKNPLSNKVSAKVEGEVVAAGTGKPLANINVELKDLTGKLVSTVLSSSQGTFSFENLGAGSYKIFAGKASIYTQDSEDIDIYNDGVVSPRYVRLTLAPEPITIFALTGYVRNQTNSGLPYLEVKLFTKSDLTDVPVITRTTGDGKFFYDNLGSAGMYYLVVSSSVNTAQSQPYPIRILTDGTTSPASIEIIVTRSENIELASQTGTVYDAFSGGFVEYASVRINGNDAGVTDKNGRFFLPDLTVGTYKIEISKFGYETLNSSFELKTGNVTIPTKLEYPLLHNMKTGYGSIAGRLVDETAPGFPGAPDRFVRLYKWIQVTKSYEKLVENATTTIEVTDWEVSDNILSTKTGLTDASQDMDMAGAFKLTHLEPGNYVVYITRSATAPGFDNVSRRHIRIGEPLTWREIDSGADAGFEVEIRKITVEDGKTTYWTNFEQPFDGN